MNVLETYHDLNSLENVNDSNLQKTNEINIVQMLFTNKNKCFSDEQTYQKIVNDINFTSLAFSLVKNDIFNDESVTRQYSLMWYVKFALILIEKKIFTHQTWKRTKKEMEILFVGDTQFVMKCIENKIINFSEVCNCMKTEEISDILSKFVSTEHKYPENVINIMITYDIPINLSHTKIDDAKFILRNFTSTCFSFNNLLSNIFINKVPVELFEEWSQINKIKMFFSTSDFYDNLVLINDSIIDIFANKLISWNSYEKFLEYVNNRTLFADPEYSNKILKIIKCIQNEIINEQHHLLLYKNNYHNIFRFTNPEILKELDFKTLIFFGMERVKYLGDEIFDILYFTFLRDNVDLELLRTIFYNYETAKCQVSNVLINVLKKTLIYDILNIESESEFVKTTPKISFDFLLFLLKNIDFTTEEYNYISNKYKNLFDENILTNEIINNDQNFTLKILKIFPDYLKESLNTNIKQFSEKTECLKDFVPGENLKKDIEVLNVLQKLNESDKFICGICSSNYIAVYYEKCKHTLCKKCVSRTHNKCPYCRQENQETNDIYFSC